MLTRHTIAAGMSTATWMQLPARQIRVAQLTPTQATAADLWPERRPTPQACADPHIHVVRLGDAWYVQDGHHRLARARRDHRETITARVFTVQ